MIIYSCWYFYAKDHNLDVDLITAKDIKVFRPKDDKFGDWSCAFGYVLAQKLGGNPEQLTKDVCNYQSKFNIIL